MRIFFAAFGSLGDVLPYVALGKGLEARGHAVTLCINSRFEELARRHGLQYAYMNDGFAQLLDSAAGREAIEGMASLWGALRSVVKLARQIGPLQRRTLDDAWNSAQKAAPDLIVFHPKLAPAIDFAEKLHAPVIAAPLFPQQVPTREFPAGGFPVLRIGGWYNKLTYKIVLKLTNLMGGKYIRNWRRANGLAARPRGGGMLSTAEGMPIPVVHGHSRYLVPRPADWPPFATTSGFWFLDPNEDWRPPLELETFLEAGEAPVYVGFGSMAGRRPERVTKIVIEALLEAEVRGIIATGWGGLEADDLPHTILKIDHAPHDWLFPRMAAVVHHGGAGTTAAGLRAGRPTIICPFFGDQPFWGARVHGLGVGTRPIAQKKLTVARLVAAIHEVTRNSTLRQNAEALGEKIRQEDGVANAISIIEGHAKTWFASTPGGSA